MLVNTNDLKAVFLAAAKNDARHYLNGVLVDGRNLVATDGSRLHVVAHGGEWAGAPVIIPRDVVEAALRAKAKETEITPATCGQTLFTPIDGVFPDYARVMARLPAKANKQAVTAGFVPAQYKDFVEAVKLVHDVRSPALSLVGTQWVWSSERLHIVIMPWRSEDARLDALGA